MAPLSLTFGKTPYLKLTIGRYQKHIVWAWANSHLRCLVSLQLLTGTLKLSWKSYVSREEVQSVPDPVYDHSAPGSVEPLQHEQGGN